MTHYPQQDMSRLILQSGTSSMIAGDHTSQRVSVVEEANVQLVGQGAVTVNRARSDVGVTEELELVARSGSNLEFLQEPRILFPGSRLSQLVTATIGGGSRIVFVDSLICKSETMDAYYSSEFRLAVDSELVAIERMGFDGSAGDSLTASALIVMAGAEYYPDDWSMWLHDHAYRGCYGSVSPLAHDSGITVRIVASNAQCLSESIEAALSVMSTRRVAPALPVSISGN